MSTDDRPIGEDDLVAAVDGRLSAERARLLDARIAEDPALGERIAAERRDREALRDRLAPIAEEPIPSRLRIAHLVEERRRAQRTRFGAIAAALLVFAAGAASGAIAMRALPSGSAPADMVAARPAVVLPTVVAEDASAAHRLFVAEVVHPVEVDAGHETHLLGWLSKRLGHPIVAPDLGRFGLKLIGGRLLPAGEGAAAQLMYEDDAGARLTVWVQATPGGETTAFRYRQDGGAGTFAWIDRGWGFAVTASMKRDGLLPIAEAIWRGFEGEKPREG
ncbi:MAG: anti-sigma factor [Hyphomicrobiales bacterium]|nr:anti-sigma factor [Hyphomicrobiales bacterium]